LKSKYIIGYDHQSVQSAPANCRAKGLQKDSIEALHLNRNPLVQEVGLSSVARVFRSPSKIIIIIIIE